MSKSEAQQQHDVIGYRESDAEFHRNLHPDADWFFHPTQVGLFIHFGISTVHGDCDISWGMMDNPARYGKNGILTPAEYWKLAARFHPDRFAPKQWLSAARAAGFTYAVLTTKHHDGFALWPSNYGELSTKNYMQGRDLVGEYVKACREVGLKVGLYYSPPDWYFNRDYMSFMSDSRSLNHPERPNKGIHHEVLGDLPKMSEEHLMRYADYINGQVTELLTRYGKIDLLWFDGTMSDTSRLLTIEDIRAMQPGIVVNDRLRGTGDYNTKYECRLPTERPESKYWEACESWHVGGGWSYVLNADVYRSWDVVQAHYELIRRFEGNYLLNIAPDRNGDVPEAYYREVPKFAELLK